MIATMMLQGTNACHQNKATCNISENVKQM